MDPRYIIYKPEEYNRQMNEVVSSRCKRNERAKRAHSLYILILHLSVRAGGHGKLYSTQAKTFSFFAN